MGAEQSRTIDQNEPIIDQNKLVNNRISQSEDLNAAKNHFMTNNISRQNSVSKFNTQSHMIRMGPAAGSGAYTKKQKVGILEVNTQATARASTTRNSTMTSGFHSSKSGLLSKLNGNDQFQNRRDTLEELCNNVEVEQRDSNQRTIKRMTRLLEGFEKMIGSNVGENGENGKLVSSMMMRSEQQRSATMAMPKQNGRTDLAAAKSAVVGEEMEENEPKPTIEKMSTTELKISLSDAFKDRKNGLVLVRTPNEHNFGICDKKIQNLLTQFNNRNFEAFASLPPSSQTSNRPNTAQSVYSNFSEQKAQQIQNIISNNSSKSNRHQAPPDQLQLQIPASGIPRPNTNRGGIPSPRLQMNKKMESATTVQNNGLRVINSTKVRGDGFMISASKSSRSSVSARKGSFSKNPKSIHLSLADELQMSDQKTDDGAPLGLKKSQSVVRMNSFHVNTKKLSGPKTLKKKTLTRVSSALGTRNLIKIKSESVSQSFRNGLSGSKKQLISPQRGDPTQTEDTPNSTVKQIFYDRKLTAQPVADQISVVGEPSLLEKFQGWKLGNRPQFHREIDLADSAILHIVQFLGMHHFMKFQLLSRHWYARILQYFNNFSEPMENQFSEMHDGYLELIKTRLNFSPTQFGNQKGMRIDRIMEIQIKNQSVEVVRNSGKTLKLENMYRYQVQDSQGNTHQSSHKNFRQNSVVFRPQGRQEDYRKSKEIVYHNSYRFDLIKSRSHARRTWVHISDSLPGYAQNEIQVAPGDRVMIGFCIYNLNGFVDVSSLQWAKPSFVKINENMINFLDYNRDKQLQRFHHPKQARGLKILCDIDRICDIEDSVYDWNKYDINSHDLMQISTIQMPIKMSPNLLEYFEVLEIFYNESDQHYNKKILRAVKPSCKKRAGSTTNFNLVLQFDEHRRFSLTILPSGAPIINEVRRRGVITDRNKREEEIQIRVGDMLALYETKHIPSEMQMTTRLE